MHADTTAAAKPAHPGSLHAPQLRGAATNPALNSRLRVQAYARVVQIHRQTSARPDMSPSGRHGPVGLPSRGPRRNPAAPQEVAPVIPAAR